jgi:aryl-alcohol dehydrogenase-like predicted oxidoreductase
MTKCFRVVCDPEEFDPGSGVTMHHGLADQSKDYVNQWGEFPSQRPTWRRPRADFARGLSRQAIFNAVEASLERLNTNYIDVLQIHRFDPTVPPEETMTALHDLVKAGAVRYLGASSMWTHQFAMLQHIAETKGLTKFISMQNHYNLIYREEEREMIKYCNMTGVGLIPVGIAPHRSRTRRESLKLTCVLPYSQWGPLASGRLARSPGDETRSLRATYSANGSLYQGDERNTNEIVSRVEEIAKKRGWPMSHVSLAWLNRRVVAPIIGFSSVERIEDALAARGKELSDEEERYLEEMYLARDVQGHS